MKSRLLILSSAAFAAGQLHASILYTNAGPVAVNETGAGSGIAGMTLSRNATSSDTLYFRFTVTNPLSNSTNEPYYAAFHFFNGAAEGFGVGNAWAVAFYSAFGGAVGVDNVPLLSQTTGSSQLVGAADTTTIVYKVEYVNGGNDKVTVWLNPDFSKTEADQPHPTTIYTNASFDSIHLREGGGGGGWTFQNMSISDTAADAGFVPVPDSDADGLPDAWEQQIITASGNTLTLADIKGPLDAPATSDYDSDGSSDAQEFARNTIPTDADSDDDGLLDGVETKTGVYVSASDTGTDPLDDDWDNDFVLDGAETNTGTFVSATDTGTNPFDNDSDNDFLIDGDETGTGVYMSDIDTGTNPNLSDTDGDGACDRLEVFGGTDPFSNTSTPVPGNLALIGADDFSYTNGLIAGRSGGTAFDFDNNALNDSFVGHTTRQSDWDLVSGNVNVTDGKLVTQNSAAKREFNGTAENSTAINSDEYLGAVREVDCDAKAVYVRADLTRGAGADWGGISIYDYGVEKVFFGVPYTAGPSGSREFGIQLSASLPVFKPSSPTHPVAGTTYTLVGKVDYANDLLTLWINPDLTKTEAENTPYLTMAYTATSWTTAMRLGSGGVGTSGATTWDNAVAAREWSAVGTFPGVTTNNYANWISTYPGAAGMPGFTQDADGDGIPNGLEQVLGTDPSAATSGLRETSHSGGTFKFRHTKTNNPVTDVTSAYQWSTDMVNWHGSGTTNAGGTSATLAAATVTDNAAPLNDEIEVTATVTTGPADKLFVRLTATNP